MTFIVRVAWDARGRLTGVVTHVQSGRKERFEGLESLGAVVAGMSDGQGRARSPSAVSRLEAPPEAE